MSEQDEVRHGQGVWCQQHANGVIVDVYYDTQEVVVEWYNSKKRDIFEMEDLHGNWNSRAKQWQLTL